MAAGVYFESAKMNKYIYKNLYTVPEVTHTLLFRSLSLHYHRYKPIPLLSLPLFLSLHGCFSALFVGVLEKTVEGEAAALTKAKTLYKSCTNESESARGRR